MTCSSNKESARANYTSNWLNYVYSYEVINRYQTVTLSALNRKHS